MEILLKILLQIVRRGRTPLDNKRSGNKKRFEGNCYNCGKVGHKALNYRVPKKNKKKNQENMVEANDEIEDLCTILTECNIVGNIKEWWFDSGTSSYVCEVKEVFAIYTPVGSEEELFMGNTSTSKVERGEKIFLK